MIYKALTVAPDWAMEYLGGNKFIDCRTWKTDYRGDIVICSSAKKMRGFISGHALLILQLVAIEDFKREHLSRACMNKMPDNKSYAWIFDKPRIIYPIPVKGKLNLFEVDIEPEFISDDISDDEIASIYNPITVGFVRQ